MLDALEQHLASLEGKKGSAANTPTQSARYADFPSLIQVIYVLHIDQRRDNPKHLWYIECWMLLKLILLYSYKLSIIYTYIYFFLSHHFLIPDGQKISLFTYRHELFKMNSTWYIYCTRTCKNLCKRVTRLRESPNILTSRLIILNLWNVKCWPLSFTYLSTKEIWIVFFSIIAVKRDIWLSFWTQLSDLKNLSMVSLDTRLILSPIFNV